VASANIVIAIYAGGADSEHRNLTLPAPGGNAIVTALPIEARAGGWQLLHVSVAAGIVPDISPDGIDYKSYFMTSANDSLAYPALVLGSSAWAKALDAIGHEHVISDALTRMQASGLYAPAAEPKYTMHPSF
jgi:hypothetical protein